MTEEFAGLSYEEVIRKLYHVVAHGPFGEWRKRKGAEQSAEIRARLDREKKEGAV